ncbi:MAG: NAD(P)-binding protein, partial [Acidobacteria bacterium]|nr:NAD(P)-binding protein [Acidobacteriota bacterium]
MLPPTTFRAFSAQKRPTPTWADGPGFHISRLWRFRARLSAQRSEALNLWCGGSEARHAMDFGDEHQIQSAVAALLGWRTPKVECSIRSLRSRFRKFIRDLPVCMSTFNRREILAAFLGLPVALAACRRSTTPPLPVGEIVGASDVFGHRLRDGQGVEVPADAWERVPVVIIGGGVAGLTAAWRLIKSGFEHFSLIELESAPGGTSRSGSNRVTSFPWGAHYIPAPMKENQALVSLLGEMGVIEGSDKDGEPIIGEQFLCRDPEERVFYKGRWYEGLYLHAGETAEDKAQLAKFNEEVTRWVSWRDGRRQRAFTIPVAACSDDAAVTELDRISMGEWMNQRGFTSARLRWSVDYACRDDYGMTLDQTSAWAGLFYFCSRVSKPNIETQPLITWPEGNGRLVNHLFDQVKAKVHLDRAVLELIPVEENGWSGVDVVTIDRDGRNPRGLKADRVIFAAPQFMARYVVR